MMLGFLFYVEWGISINVMSLFVIIVTVGSKDIYIYLCFKNTVHQTMLLCNGSRPSIFRFALERFRMSCSSLWMDNYFIQ